MMDIPRIFESIIITNEKLEGMQEYEYSTADKIKEYKRCKTNKVGTIILTINMLFVGMTFDDKVMSSAAIIVAYKAK